MSKKGMHCHIGHTARLFIKLIYFVLKGHKNEHVVAFQKKKKKVEKVKCVVMFVFSGIQMDHVYLQGSHKVLTVSMSVGLQTEISPIVSIVPIYFDYSRAHFSQKLLMIWVTVLKILES